MSDGLQRAAEIVDDFIKEMEAGSTFPPKMIAYTVVKGYLGAERDQAIARGDGSERHIRMFDLLRALGINGETP